MRRKQTVEQEMYEYLKGHFRKWPDDEALDDKELADKIWGDWEEECHTEGDILFLIDQARSF